MSVKLVMHETMTWLVRERISATQISNEIPTYKNFWTTTVLLILVNTKKLYSWCSVRVEKEGIQIVEQEIGSVRRMCRGIVETFQFTMVKYMN
jgi:hypothetical protein